MSDDSFEDIVGNMGDADDDEKDFDTPLDVVANYWKAFHPGSIFIKGILIVESTLPGGDGRVLRYETTSPSSEWEVLGMVESVRQQFMAHNFVEAMIDANEDDDDDDEDEQ